jgi:imidazolonepropionase-like amidohydrolase
MPAIMQTLLDPKSPVAMMFTNSEMSKTIASAFAGSLQQTAKAIRAGVPVLAGSDAGNPVTFHGISLVRELELLAQAGMPLGDVLKSATARAADRIGQPSLGRIAAGAIADIVVLDADPTEAASAYRKVSNVYLGGRKLDRAVLTSGAPGTWRTDIR